MSSLRAIPNLFTLGNLLAGATALALLQADASPVAVLACTGTALLCDLLDGRIARALKIDNPFGTQLDSLADVVSFGLVPSLAIWQWKLSALGPWAAPAAFALAAAAAWRLARFNVQAGGPPKKVRGAARSTGLPVTFPAALLLAGAVVWPDVSPRALLAICPALGFLMVGTLPYRTFKDRSPRFMVGLAAVVLGVAVAFAPSVAGAVPMAIALGALAYTVSAPVAAVAGLTRSASRGRRRLTSP